MPRSQEFRVILKIQSSYKGAFSEKSCSHFAVNRCGANKEAKTLRTWRLGVDLTSI